MKRTGLLILVVMLLATASASAQPRIGSHPAKGDQDGVRAAIIGASLAEGGVVLNRTAIESLGLNFTYLWMLSNAVARRDPIYSPGAGVPNANPENEASCACGAQDTCDGSCAVTCACEAQPQLPAPEEEEGGGTGSGPCGDDRCRCGVGCIAGSCILSCPGK